MPAQTRSRGKPSAATTYRSTAAAPKQQEFPNRRRSAKTYGRSKPRNMIQETLTQMNFTSSSMPEFIDLLDEEEEEGEPEEDVENTMELAPLKLVEKPAAKAKPKREPRSSSRRKTAGDQIDVEENLRQSKRRKTLGDVPSSSISSSFHTQTLTQMLSTDIKDEDPWQIEDSQDDEDSKSIIQTPKKGSGCHIKNDLPGGTQSTVPSLIKSATPANRQRKMEIPSSQSPPTPMFQRYSPAPEHSPLISKSTNVGAPPPNLQKTPRTAIIPDSYSTAHESSPIPTEKSTVKATPSKRLRFDLPDDKENITPGRTKPKTPKPKTSSAGRQPLREVPDSDEEMDEESEETEYETEEDEFGAGDPESPTPKRFHHVPSVELPERELELSPSGKGRHLAEKANEPVAQNENQLLSHESDQESRNEASSIPEHEPAASPYPPLTEQASGLERPAVATGSVILDQDLDLGPRRGLEAVRPEQDVSLAPTPAAEQTPEPAPSQQSEDDDAAGAMSMTQDFGYTQGLESQRLPLDSIRALGPQTTHSDIMVSLHPEHIARIVDGTKNHEFRAWKIPQQVSRIWIYITRPASQLRYMCLFGEPKTPGEIEDENGIGNVDFNQGKKAAKFAYEILQVYELNNPVSLDEMKKKGWVAGAPQKYTYIPPAVVGELTANLRCALFEEASPVESADHKGVSESQELTAQLQTDADYSTQHYSEMMDEVIPASQSPRKPSANSKAMTDKEDFVRPAPPRVRSNSSDHGSSPLPSQRQTNAVRPSQATTVSQMSSSPVISPGKSGHRPILLSSQSGDGRNSRLLRRMHSSLRSSQFPTASQMLPDSLLNHDIEEPPPIVWDSADEHSD
ncbi:hypothetical protein F5X97DRAFT_305347 [Nemania serpens]|nr:hypothetical protein F5X97DRAFT_305347 [Nemania serpens]